MGGIAVESILSLPPDASGANLGAGAGRGATWLRVSSTAAGSDNLWDDAHTFLARGGGFAAAGNGVLAVEPDIVQQWDYKNSSGDRGMAASASPACTFDDQDPSGGQATEPGVVAWNAGPAFSQFTDARNKVGNKQSNITIAHLDTGFDPGHRTLPAGLLAAKQRNFVDDGTGPDNATELLLYYIYEIGFRFWDPAYAAALTIVLLAILALMALAQFGFLARRVHYQ